MNFIRSTIPIFLGMLVLGACSKPKLDSATGNLPTQLQLSSSTVRIVNLGGFTDLAVNGVQLTDFVLPDIYGNRFPSPTTYFPATGTLGMTYLIPQQFLDSSHSAAVQLAVPVSGGLTPGTYYHEAVSNFGVTEDYSHPNDYYWIYSRTAGGGSFSYSDSLVVIPRAISPAADPTHFLVRMVNLSSAPDDAGLIGPMRLAYADGSHVATGAADSLVSPGNYTAYYELPYGTYQFKVLTSQGSQVPGAPVNMQVPIITDNQFTAIMQGLGVTYAPIQTFQPGGVYTIVVSVNHNFQYPYGTGDVGNNYNAYQVITDVAPAANVTYARIQAVNAVPGEAVTVSVDGAPLVSSLAYDSVTAYQAYVTGAHQVTVQDGTGKTLASKSFNLQGNTNFTIWTFPSGDSVDFLLAQNNLSGNESDTYNADGSDAAPDITFNSFPYIVRFLNLCPDLPYVTFTQANGALFADGNSSFAVAAQNLPFGGQLSSSAVPFPYVSANGGTGGISSQIQVYQSQLQPKVIPGNWLSDIPALQNTDFISMPASFYPGGLPTGEPGVYTVALTGRYGQGITPGQQAKMIIIKHTK
jgi:hypothetical protein